MVKIGCFILCDFYHNKNNFLKNKKGKNAPTYEFWMDISIRTIAGSLRHSLKEKSQKLVQDTLIFIPSIRN